MRVPDFAAEHSDLLPEAGEDASVRSGDHRTAAVPAFPHGDRGAQHECVCIESDVLHLHFKNVRRSERWCEETSTISGFRAAICAMYSLK